MTTMFTNAAQPAAMPALPPNTTAVTGTVLPNGKIEGPGLTGTWTKIPEPGEVPANAFATDDAPVPAGSPSLLPLPGAKWSVGARAANGFEVSSVGDPHETTGDGFKFDNMRRGEFVKLRSATGDFELQTRQDAWDQNPQATVNTAAAIRANAQGDTVAYDAKTKQLTFNGKAIEVKAGEPFQIPGGGTIEKTADGFDVKSAKGDQVRLLDRGTYLDVSATVSPERKDGEVRGSLGNVDADTDATNDMVGRDGERFTDVEKFLDEWEVTPEERLFGKAGAPAGTDDPVGGQGPTEQQEPKPGEQGAAEGLTDKQLEGLFMLLDRDGDGEIGKAELKAMLKRLAALEDALA